MLANIGQVVLYPLSIFGGIVAIVQAYKWVSGRRNERGLARFLEHQADIADSEAVRLELLRLESTVRAMRRAAPEIARRQHLEQRRRDIGLTLGGAWTEYHAIADELEGSDPTAGLPIDAVAVLEAEILPAYRAERRAQLSTRLLLLYLAISLLFPKQPLLLLFHYGYLVFAPPAHLNGSIFLTIPVAIALGAILGAGAAPRIGRRSTMYPTRGVLILLAIVSAALACLMALASVWTAGLEQSTFEAYQWVGLLNTLTAILVSVLLICLREIGLRPVRFVANLRSGSRASTHSVVREGAQPQ